VAAAPYPDVRPGRIAQGDAARGGRARGGVSCCHGIHNYKYTK